MPSRTQTRLQRSLLLAQASLADAPQAQSMAHGDPLGLGLPPLLNGATLAALPTAAALQALAALYLHAELEQTGLILVAEGLAAERSALALRTEQAAARLEQFAEQQRQWYDRGRRMRVFARLFGLGSPVGGEENTIFQQEFARVCHGIGQMEVELRSSGKPSARTEAALRLALRALLINLGAHQYGDTLLAGRKIQEQLRAAAAILEDPDVGALVQGRGLWDTLRKILGDRTPDLGRLLSRGQSGQRLLTWMALARPNLTQDHPTDSRDGFSRLLPAGSPVFTWAATWLEATGVILPNRARESL